MTDDVVKRLRDRSEMVYDHAGVDRQLDADAADEIERLRGLVDWLADEVSGNFVDHPTYGPVMSFTDSWGDLAYDDEAPVPDHIAELLRRSKAKRRAAWRDGDTEGQKPLTDLEYIEWVDEIRETQKKNR